MELSPDNTARLRDSRPETPPPPPPRRGPHWRALRLGKRLARGLLRPVIDAEVEAHVREPRELAHGAQRRVDELEQQLTSLQRRSLEAELHATTVNLELLKGEVRSVVQALEDLGMAIAPATGLAGAGVRLSELRERVNGLDRRLRSLVSAPPPGRQPEPERSGGAAPNGAGTAGTEVQSALFDYVGFERRFRGDPEAITAELAARYLDLLVANPPVIDIGCGNAGLVELLTKRGIEVIGVDTDPSMVAEARDRGLDVRQVDGASFLRGREPASLGAIIATHVVEHIELGDLVALLELAATRLRPGGVFIAETPNPTSLIVLGNSYILDPTHLRPLHPSLLVFLCEGAGFRDVRLRFYSPASDYQLPLIDQPDAPAWTARVNQAFTKLNSVLFGPQEYAVIATAAPAPGAEPESDGADVSTT